MLTPELANGLVVITTVSLASCILIPIFCWLLVNHANAVEKAHDLHQTA